MLLKGLAVIGLLVTSSTALAQDKRIDLSWEWELPVRWAEYDSSGAFYELRTISDPEKFPGSISARRATIRRDQLEVIFVVHNQSDRYTCFFVNGDKDTVHLDDDFGNEYKGATLILNDGQDAKLAPNQRKNFKLRMPAPSPDALSANFHFGFLHAVMEHNSGQCPDPQINSYFQHKLNVDVSSWRN
ncbi:hypothetical protein ACFO5Q_04615 [Kordiimonas lipolytica]|uniref:Uncharacterized protein n=1 Tax=Kordiimonas lipolytica TaxID=1662421 RepID=A0ABV8U937_9PROT|nr:hypothetical protein [Kordiimonas lipolytica]